MKKNIFLFVLCFFSFFLFSSNVKAEEIVDFKFPTTLVNSDGYDFSLKLEELENALNTTGKEYVIILRRISSGVNYYSFIEGVYLFDSIPGFYFSGSGISIPYSSANKYKVSNGISIDETSLNSLISIVQNGSYLNNITNASVNLYQNSGSFNTLYSSSFDILNTSSYTYRFNDDYSVKNGDKILTFKTLPKPAETYTENLTINTKNIDRIEYTFDFSNVINSNNHFVHEFNFSTSWEYENSSWDCYDYPYLQYKKGGLIYELPLKDKTSESLESLVYFDTQLNPFTDIEELKFIVPFKKISTFDDSSMFIHFDSNLNFEKNIYTINENVPTNPNPGGLQLKNSFNSGTNAYGMGKITWNVEPGSDLSLTDGKTWFKIQYGSNDFTNKNVPFLSRYRIFGKNTNDSEWIEITDNNLIYIDNINYRYDTSETVMTGSLRMPHDRCIYEQLQIEFYFDNTVNFYMYVYDDLTDENNWKWTEKFLENYRYYEFPKNMKYGFVSHKKNYDNSGIVYVPYNFTINENTLFSVSVLDYNTDMILRNIDCKEFTEDNYYSYYDFSFSHKNNEVLMLRRKKSNEKLYFYVHEDYIVTFTDTKESILTPDGVVEIDTSKIFDILEKDDDTSLFSMFHFFEKPIKFLFDGVGTLYNDYVPAVVQKYWFFALGFTVFIIILKLLF